MTFSFLEDVVQDFLVLATGKVLADYYVSVLTRNGASLRVTYTPQLPCKA